MIRIPEHKKKNASLPPEGGEEDRETSRAERIVKSASDREDSPEDCFEDACDKRPVINKTKAEEKRDAVLSAALRILQCGANSKKMLRDKLLKKGFSKDDVERAILFCEEQSLLHEQRLFSAHTAYLAEKKHFGKSRLRLELLKKFDRQSFDDFFDEAIAEIDFSHYARIEAEKSARRGKGYVVSRLRTLGFSAHEIYEALETVVFDEPSD